MGRGCLRWFVAVPDPPYTKPKTHEKRPPAKTGGLFRNILCD